MSSRPKRETRPRPRSLADRRAAVADLVDTTQPANARTVLATALLGAAEPTLPVSHLVEVAKLFGITPGATRTCLWRMAAKGDLTTDQATYTLTGRLLERRREIDVASRSAHNPTEPWDGTWELAVVTVDRRGQMDRLDLRKAAAALQLAELREGVWTRPDNLDPRRSSDAREVVRHQCAEFRNAETSLEPALVDELFGLADWAATAARFITAMDDEDSADDEEPARALQFQFTLSVAVVAHLRTDPRLPTVLLPTGWPAEMLRTRYLDFDRAFQQRMTDAVG
jgi:phenylacetic acid degradation operon negative regulatory protein